MAVDGARAGTSSGGRGRVTITDIARRAGVSVPTVSRVVNGRSDVSPGTRARVEELLRRHGYRKRAAAPGRRAALLDLVFNDLDSPWAVEIIRGVEEVAHAAGAGTVVSAVHGRSGGARQWMRNLRARASDGVVLVTSALDPVLHQELRVLGVPLVVVDPAGSPALDVPTVGAANHAGGRAATEHLLALGHRRIGLIAGPPRLLCSRARHDGYRAALRGAGLAVDDSLVVPGDFRHESGFAACDALLGVPEPPTAVFAASDQMALGAIEALRRRGLRVPQDVSVVGFDDLPEVRWSAPPLTTVRQPLAEMGRVAARTVLRPARDERPDPPRVELGTELIVRSSTAPPPRRAARCD
ncbi:LacI family DNA-binding transcriptional regulator [Streptomyces sp. NA03103]|uniref:LacI family DNA-binding transcriptional regulator n=1 Tax=Streptomyces TaxID=1883 RepID=UPI00158FBB83|nr:MULTISPECIES: LacI family DNA-binding transcriptional regulator [Streptomyces]MBH5131746.1 LacI family DNA-binding transcriptional regulator [Streptomyces sp. HB-N217]QKW64476.1 LacI family DNA-binding transcriptional regulator [Streptomyces sp. NA03103]WSU04854.1 LacI family transcriptional regulator [Streptomyces sp. NBC_01124]